MEKQKIRGPKRGVYIIHIYIPNIILVQIIVKSLMSFRGVDGLNPRRIGLYQYQYKLSTDV